MFCLNGFANLFLLTQRFCIPTWKGHYVTGPDIVVFSNAACIENNLTKLTSQCKNAFNSFKSCKTQPCCYGNRVINK